MVVDRGSLPRVLDHRARPSNPPRNPEHFLDCLNRGHLDAVELRLLLHGSEVRGIAGLIEVVVAMGLGLHHEQNLLGVGHPFYPSPHLDPLDRRGLKRLLDTGSSRRFRILILLLLMLLTHDLLGGHRQRLLHPIPLLGLLPQAYCRALGGCGFL